MYNRGGIGAALAAFALLAACSAGDEEAAERPLTRVVAEPLRMVADQAKVDAVGTARGTTTAALYPEAAGLVREVTFGAGDYVRAGAPLVRLDDQREQLAVRLARVAVAEAEQLLGRYRRIEDSGAVSASQIDAGETALQSAQIRLDQAEVALAERTVRAPFAGHMGIPHIDRGARATPTTLIATIDDQTELFVDFPAPEASFGALRVGATVALMPYSEPNRSIEATVAALDSSIAADTRTFTVRTVIANKDDAFRPGMSFRANFSVSGRMRPAVPESAVVWGGDGSYLWAVRDDVARRVPMTIAGRRQGLVLFNGDLAANEKIIVEGVQKVREGQQVTMVEREVPETQQVMARAPKDAL